MRVSYRAHHNRDYWEKRWASIEVDTGEADPGKYPLKYAQRAVSGRGQKILEAGCGAGRLLRYYHTRGYRIVGMDFIASAVEKLKTADPTLDVRAGDIRETPFQDGEFDVVLAFGLYHNFEDKPVGALSDALRETWRILKPGGVLCASFRADNIQNRAIDWVSDRKSPRDKARDLKFHKLNLTRDEFAARLESAGFQLQEAHDVENMPVLYQFPIFRAGLSRKMDETGARASGYRLNPVGAWIQSTLMKISSRQFCNIYVVIARKPNVT